MKSSTLFASLLFAYTAFAHAEDYRLVCPATINVQQSIKNAPEGWTAGIFGGDAVNVKYLLTNVEFSSGDPSGLAWLVPDADKKTRSMHTATWNFTPHSKDGYWISCDYTHTSVSLVKRLPDQIKSCTIEYDARYSDLVVKDVRCQ
jgi:hypothetical protein